jgi:hypothetical protein
MSLYRSINLLSFVLSQYPDALGKDDFDAVEFRIHSPQSTNFYTAKSIELINEVEATIRMKDGSERSINTWEGKGAVRLDALNILPDIFSLKAPEGFPENLRAEWLNYEEDYQQSSSAYLNLKRKGDSLDFEIDVDFYAFEPKDKESEINDDFLEQMNISIEDINDSISDIYHKIQSLVSYKLPSEINISSNQEKAFSNDLYPYLSSRLEDHVINENDRSEVSKLMENFDTEIMEIFEEIQSSFREYIMTSYNYAYTSTEFNLKFEENGAILFDGSRVKYKELLEKPYNIQHPSIMDHIIEELCDNDFNESVAQVFIEYLNQLPSDTLSTLQNPLKDASIEACIKGYLNKDRQDFSKLEYITALIKKLNDLSDGKTYDENDLNFIDLYFKEDGLSGLDRYGDNKILDQREKQQLLLFNIMARFAPLNPENSKKLTACAVSSAHLNPTLIRDNEEHINNLRSMWGVTDFVNFEETLTDAKKYALPLIKAHCKDVISSLKVFRKIVDDHSIDKIGEMMVILDQFESEASSAASMMIDTLQEKGMDNSSREKLLNIISDFSSEASSITDKMRHAVIQRIEASAENEKKAFNPDDMFTKTL